MRAIFRYLEPSEENIKKFILPEYKDRVVSENIMLFGVMDPLANPLGALCFWEDTGGVKDTDLKYIYVSREYRNSGIGGMLLREATKTCIGRGKSRISCDLPDEGYVEIKSLLDRKGYDGRERYLEYLYDLKGIRDSALGKNIQRILSGRLTAPAWDGIDDDMLRRFISRNRDYESGRILEEGVPEAYREYSRFFVIEGELRGVLLCRKSGEKEVIISSTHAEKLQSAEYAGPIMFGYALSSMMKKMTDDTRVILRIRERNQSNSVEKPFGKALDKNEVIRYKKNII